MPIKWTRPKKAEKVPCAECPVPGADAAPSAKHPAPKPKGKAKGKPANAKATADKKEAK